MWLMELLHGKVNTSSGLGSAATTGWPGLREVLFVVPSRLWSMKAGSIDQKVAFRQTSSYGLSDFDRSEHNKLSGEIAKAETGLEKYPH
jgi:hypothetical protein